MDSFWPLGRRQMGVDCVRTAKDPSEVLEGGRFLLTSGSMHDRLRPCPDLPRPEVPEGPEEGPRFPSLLGQDQMDGYNQRLYQNQRNCQNNSALQISWVWHFPSLKNSMTLCVTAGMTLYLMQNFVWHFTSLREYDTICMTQKVQPSWRLLHRLNNITSTENLSKSVLKLSIRQQKGEETFSYCTKWEICEFIYSVRCLQHERLVWIASLFPKNCEEYLPEVLSEFSKVKRRALSTKIQTDFGLLSFICQ